MKKLLVSGVCLVLVCSNAFAWRIFMQESSDMGTMYTIQCENGKLETINSNKYAYITSYGTFDSLNEAASVACSE